MVCGGLGGSGGARAGQGRPGQARAGLAREGAIYDRKKIICDRKNSKFATEIGVIPQGKISTFQNGVPRRAFRCRPSTFFSVVNFLLTPIDSSCHFLSLLQKRADFGKKWP